MSADFLYRQITLNIFFANQSIFFCWTFPVQTLANVVLATTHFSCLRAVFTFHPTHLHWLKA